MELQLAIGILLSALIGISLGLLGGGGSTITVPILVYVIGVDPHEAIAMSLAVVGATSLLGAVLHRREGRVDVRVGLVFAGSGLVTAFVGSRITHLLPPRALLLAFAGIMMIVGTMMLVRRHDPATREVHRSMPRIVGAGAGVGLLTGVLGVGGGFLIVPALLFFGGLGMPEAVGTSLLVIAANCFAGLAGHVRYAHIDWSITAWVTGAALGGSVLGARLAGVFSPLRLRKLFAVLIWGVAVFLVIRNV